MKVRIQTPDGPFDVGIESKPISINIGGVDIEPVDVSDVDSAFYYGYGEGVRSVSVTVEDNSGNEQ